MPENHPILFTLEHARRVLSRIRPAVEAMVRAHHGLQVHNEILHDPGERLSRNGGSRLSAETIELMGSLQRALVAIRSEGVLVKDVGQGLLDFPSIHEGRVVYLCWMHGEPEIGFWHEQSAGFAARRPIGEA